MSLLILLWYNGFIFIEKKKKLSMGFQKGGRNFKDFWWFPLQWWAPSLHVSMHGPVNNINSNFCSHYFGPPLISGPGPGSNLQCTVNLAQQQYHHWVHKPEKNKWVFRHIQRIAKHGYPMTLRVHAHSERKTIQLHQNQLYSLELGKRLIWQLFFLFFSFLAPYEHDESRDNHDN